MQIDLKLLQPVASTQMNIPTVREGEICTGGTLDDNVRHAITKLVIFICN